MLSNHGCLMISDLFRRHEADQDSVRAKEGVAHIQNAFCFTAGYHDDCTHHNVQGGNVCSIVFFILRLLSFARRIHFTHIH